MYKGKKVAVVVPSYNEERFIAEVLTTIPPFVDKIYAVNDGSTDHTLEIMQSIARQDGNITVTNRKEQGGIGAAVTTGHRKALADGMDLIAVMAGDGQMDPFFLDKLLDPLVAGIADYAKGNRFINPEYERGTPPFRIFGSFLLNYLNKIASGYWHVSDPQQGYTAISSKTLQKINLDKLYKGFAFENDLLVKLNLVMARVIEIPVAPRYGNQRSKIRYHSFIIKTSWLLLKDFVWRIWVKHVKRPSDNTLAIAEKAQNESRQIL